VHAIMTNTAARSFPQMKKGDKVMVHKAALSSFFAAAVSGVEAATAKLKSLPLWQGPDHIMARPSPYVYEVDLPRGTRIHRRINVKNLHARLRQASTGTGRTPQRRGVTQWKASLTVKDETDKHTSSKEFRPAARLCTPE